METRGGKTKSGLMPIKEMTRDDLEAMREFVANQQAQLNKERDAFDATRSEFEKEREDSRSALTEERAFFDREREQTNRKILELQEQLRRQDIEGQRHADLETPQGPVLTERVTPRRETDRLLPSHGTLEHYGHLPSLPRFDTRLSDATYNDSHSLPSFPKLTYREALDTVPQFDGYNVTVSSFARACRRAREIIPPGSERNLTRLLITKLRGRALAAVEDEPCDSVIQLIDTLNNAFGALKTIDQLRGELSTIHLRRNEHILDFIGRVKDLRSSITDAERRERGRLTERLKADIDSLTARSFCEGLPLNYRLQFKATDYSNPTEAFCSAKAIARRQELDHSLFGNNDRTESRQLAPISRPMAHSTLNRPFSSPVSNHRDGYQNFRGYNRESQNRYEPASRGTNDRYTSRSYQHNSSTAERERYIPRERRYDPRPDERYRSRIQENASRENVQSTDNRAEKWCRYCKTNGHEIQECRKKQYNDAARGQSGNGQDPSNRQDAHREDRTQQRPIHMMNSTNDQPPASEQ